ncbi:MAG: arylamine N-acetyltransferase [Eubacteriaceae bacterium]|nr:arylamine N-acetyltransferase [Eubacteriaceae bacterium]
MSNELFDIPAYFERIGYTGDGEVSIETLKGLHTAHVMNVPFENIDGFNKKPISLDLDDLFEKIVTNKRGGYCFEMNGLFSFLLETLGFRVSNLFARVWHNGFEQSGKTHQVLLVEIDGDSWLCDVGFGGNGPLSPIRLEEGLAQEHFGRSHRIIVDPSYGYVLQYKIKDEFQPVYAFTEEKCYPSDYTIANYFTSTHSSCLFTQSLVCTKPTKDGRITLFDSQLKIVANELETVTELGLEEEIREALQSYFGLSETLRNTIP